MNKMYLQRIFAVVLLFVLNVVTGSEALTCDDCRKANSSLLISCMKNGSTTDLCSDSNEANCTIKEICVGTPSNSSHTASASISPTKSIIPPSTSSQKASSLSSSKTASPSSTKPHPTPSPTPTKKPTTRPPKPPPHVPHSGRKFDTASFIGGILLCGGVILLVYIAVRCYKAKPDYSRL